MRPLSRTIRTFTTLPTAPTPPPPTTPLPPLQKTLLIVGLGNTSHPSTRHNAGFAAIDALAARLPLTHKWYLSKPIAGFTAITSFESKDVKKPSPREWRANVVLVKPKGFMNLSGVSVAKAAKQHKVHPTDILILHDDLERKLGSLSYKPHGSANGHNGLRSIQSTLHTDAFPRLRIGIGRPVNKDDVASYVLQKFEMDELEVLEEDVFGDVERLVKEWVGERMEVAVGVESVEKREAGAKVNPA
ncbi:peptidyl-tRNA hydrolase protein 1 [Podochytrium sp. JEL0797]|nr:peptidyl-tRNA hydrolase protein 1 [Podochytrium sp. JEL0797]